MNNDVTNHLNNQLVSWNQTQTDYPKNQTIVSLFEQQVQKTPEHTALIFEGHLLTYQQLNERANQIAHYLMSLQHPSEHRPLIAPDTLVGICVERSLEMVIGLLAILKAGGAYVPLDPEYPTERLRFMLEDSQVPVLLTQQHLFDRLPVTATPSNSSDSELTGGESEGTQYACSVCLLDAAQHFDSQPKHNPQSDTQANDLAYVIYTSGSTGRPKGVCIPQRAVNRLVCNTDYHAFSAKERIAQASNASFDAATFEIWGALLNGACLVYIPKHILLNPANLSTHLKQYAISSLFITTALFNKIVQEQVDAFDELEYLLFGGEQVDPLAVRRLLNHMPPKNFLHVYGPTESTTFATWYLIDSVAADAHTVPIGKPLANTRVYILDEDNQPQAIGESGELCIGGDGLARGYLNRPELTAEKFIDVELWGKTERIYKTGDLARWLPEGNIEFLGRIDHQIKLRGFRVELGEIEAVLNQHALIEQSVITCQETARTHDKRLIAYVVPTEDHHLLEESGDTFVDQWEQLYNETYEQLSRQADLNLNTTGWNSSYTNQAIPTEEMRVWAESTVETIQSLQPNEVFEIGVGSGMLLSRIAPHVKEYWRGDFSPVALEQIENLKQQQAELRHVVLTKRTADDFSGIQHNQFDTVIINSVIQYFPSVDYLVTVLEKAVDAIKPGGHLFIGDIRSLPLLHTFHASVQMFKAKDNFTQAQLQRYIHQKQVNDKELVVDPRLFIALYQQNPRITGIRIQPHQGEAKNEMTRFRYQVVLDIEHEQAAQPQIDWQNWNETLTLGQLKQQLLDKPSIMGLRKVANARLQSEVAIVDWVDDSATQEQTVGAWRQVYAQHDFGGIEPEALWQLGKDLGYKVDISWLNMGDEGCFDVLFKRTDDTLAQYVTFPIPPIDFTRWQDYTSNPLQGQISEKLIPQLRDHLHQQLPDYMVPSAFVLMDAFPLTPNGKIDRKALPDPESIVQAGKREYVAPRNELEMVLAAIWCELLGVEPIGIHDNFFELGGHSLLATQVVSRLRQSFSMLMDIPIQALFEAPTIAELVVYLKADEECLPRDKTGTLETIKPVDRGQFLPLSFPQQQVLFLDQLGGGAAYNVPLAFKLEGALNVRALQQSLQTVVDRHEIFRTTYEVMEDEPRQSIHTEMSIDLPVINVSHYPQDEQEVELTRLLIAEANGLFDLRHDLMLRVTLFRLNQAGTQHVLLLNQHHIAMDGWSVGVLAEELAKLYGAFCAEQPSPLPPLPIQYADFAVWQHNYLQGKGLDRLLGYWEKQLAGVPELLHLPTDFSRPSEPRFKGDMVVIVIEAELINSVRRLGQEQGSTLYVTLLTAFQVLMSYYSGQTDVVVGSGVANRNYQEIESLIGFFANILALRADLAERDGQVPSFLTILEQAKITMQGAYKHQELPFNLLVEKLQPTRNRYTPLIQVLFSLQNAHKMEFEFPNLEVTDVLIQAQVSRFDLEVHTVERFGVWYSYCVFNTDLFSQQTIERLLADFTTLLTNIVAHPEQTIDSLTANIRSAEKSIRPSRDHDEVLERCLLQSPAIHACCVVTRTALMLGPKPIAYIVPTSAFSAEELQAHLSSLLPQAQWPYAYVPVSSLPLMANGEVDLEALQAIPVVDHNLLLHWEHKLKALPEIDQVAVVPELSQQKRPSLHMVKPATPMQALTAYYTTHAETETNLNSSSLTVCDLFGTPSDCDAIYLENMPLSPDSTIDLKALSEPNTTAKTNAKQYTPPSNEVEKKIANIWCKILAKEKISIHDNFFKLGGTSMLAARAHQALQQDYPVFKVVDLFNTPTIHGLANNISSKS